MTLLSLLNTPSFPQAKCVGEDPDFFFPVSQVELEERIQRLRQICGSCIHEDPCRKFAMNNEEENGFWGGTTPDERYLLSKNKEVGSRRLREIEALLSQGYSKRDVARILNVQLASIERTLDRAKKKGILQ
jgi:DNA-binding NarL/FixJ family response regulator